MADPAVPPVDAQATPPAPASTQTTPPSTTATPGTPEIQTSQDGRIDPADFSHPEYGTKLKNAYEGMTSAQRKAAEHERTLREREATLGQVKSLFAAPAVRAAVLAHLKTQGYQVPDEDAAEPKEPDERETLRNEVLGSLRAEMGMRDFILELGGGDPRKGQEAWDREAEHLVAIMDEMNRMDSRTQLNLASEILRARRAATTPPPPPASAPAGTGTPMPPRGSAASEMGRGTGASAPTEVTGPLSVEDWLKLSGTDRTGYLAALQREGVLFD